jgi:hypothetical protein
MSLVVSWDGPGFHHPDRGNVVTVTTLAALEAAFERVAAQAAADGIPYGVQVWDDQLPAAVMLGIGHPERAFLDWLDRSEPYGRASRYAVQRDVPPAQGVIGFDIYSHWSERGPERTQVTPAAALEAAREYARTLARPTNVDWVGGPPYQ